MNNPPYEFFTHLFFASEIILIFGGLFLHRIHILIRVIIDCISVPTNDFVKQKWITRGENPNSIQISWKARKRPTKVSTKNRPFVFCTFSKGRIGHILSSRLKLSQQVRFNSYGSSYIVDKYENDHVCSEEYIFTDKIDPITSNGVSTISGKDLIPKRIGTVSWY